MVFIARAAGDKTGWGPLESRVKDSHECRALFAMRLIAFQVSLISACFRHYLRRAAPDFPKKLVSLNSRPKAQNHDAAGFCPYQSTSYPTRRRALEEAIAQTPSFQPIFPNACANPMLTQIRYAATQTAYEPMKSEACSYAESVCSLFARRGGRRVHARPSARNIS